MLHILNPNDSSGLDECSNRVVKCDVIIAQMIFLGGGVPPGPENPYPISDLTQSQNVYPISDPVRYSNFSNSQWIYGVRDFVTPQTMFVFFFRKSMSTATHVTLKWYPRPNRRNIHPISDQMSKCIPYFRLEMLENDTLWGGIYLYAPPPPPPEVVSQRPPSVLPTSQVCRWGYITRKQVVYFVYKIIREEKQN